MPKTARRSTIRPLAEHIHLREILTSHQLAQRLIATGLTAPAARQVISRNSDPAVAVLQFNLPRGARLFTRQEYTRSEDFYQNVASILTTLRPGLARTIQALLTHKILMKAEAQRLLAAPLQPNRSRTPPYDKEVSVLVKSGLCSVEGSATALERLTIRSLVGTSRSHQYARTWRARQTVTMRLTRVLIDQLRKQAVIGWDSTTFATLETVTVPFSGYVFSAFSYSWLYPLVRTVGAQRKPMPVLFDVFSRDCCVYDVDAFIHRLRQAGSNRKTRISLLGVIAAHSFTDRAWDVAKKHGLLAINLRQLYGRAALETLAKMEHLLSVAVAGGPFGQHDYDGLADDVEALRVHPYVSDLRSLGLEIVAAVLLRAKGWDDIRLGVPVPFRDKTRDIDVMGTRGGEDELYIVECKAAHEEKDIDPADVRKFFTETVPAALKRYSNVKKCQAEFWTTGRIGQAASDQLTDLCLAARVTPKLLGKAALISELPSALLRCKRLIATLSLPK